MSKKSKNRKRLKRLEREQASLKESVGCLEYRVDSLENEVILLKYESRSVTRKIDELMRRIETK